MNDTGRPAAEVLAELEARQGQDPSIHGGRLFGLVYPTGRADLETVMSEATARFLFGNALNPFKFTELAAIEREVIEAVATLVHTPAQGGGTMTSGGTESILMSMLVSRERARARGIERPEILAPYSAHPAYAKAAHYFGMELVRFGLDGRYRADVAAAQSRLTSATAVIVASAVNYPYGIMDPIPSSLRWLRPTAWAATSTPASAGSSCRSWSGSGTTSLPGTSGSKGSPRSRPTSTSTATARRVRRSCFTATLTGLDTRSSCSRTGRRVSTAPPRWPAPARPRRSPRPGRRSSTSAPRAIPR